MTMTLATPRAAFDRVAAAAVHSAGPVAIPAAEGIAAVLAALGATILPNRIEIRTDRGRSMTLVVRQRRVLRLLDPDRRATAAEVAGAWHALIDGAHTLTIARRFLPLTEDGPATGVPLRDIAAALRAPGPGLATARLVPDAAPEIELPPEMPPEAADWFRAAIDRYLAASPATPAGPSIVRIPGAPLRRLAVLPAPGGVLLMMPLPRMTDEGFEAAVRAADAGEAR